MTPLFADAFFFVALLNPKDRAHRPAQSYLAPSRIRPLVTTSWVLVEVGDAMATTGRNREAFLHFEQAGFRALLRGS